MSYVFRFLLSLSALIFSISLGSFSSIYAQESNTDILRQLIDNDLSYIDEAGKALLEEFGKKDVLYVSLGRAPAAILAYLQLQVGVNAISLPISELRNYGEVNTFTAEEWSAFENHLRNFLLIPQTTKKIILLDYISSGDGLMKSAQIIERYLQRRSFNLEVIPAAFSSQNDSFYLDRVPTLDGAEARYFHNGQPVWRRIIVSEEASAVVRDEYKPYSPYGKADVLMGNSLPDPEVINPKFLQLKSMLQLSLQQSSCKLLFNR